MELAPLFGIAGKPLLQHGAELLNQMPSDRIALQRSAIAFLPRRHVAVHLQHEDMESHGSFSRATDGAVRQSVEVAFGAFISDHAQAAITRAIPAQYVQNPIP